MNSDYDIAIVGMSCRFPGAGNVYEFWHNLVEGIESIAVFSDQEILESGVPRSYLDSPNYVKAAPILNEPGHFDAGFFGFSPMEAKAMDPQHRILMELAYEALEDAGCDPERYNGRVGVFTGTALNTYFMSSGMNRRLAEDYIPTLILNDKDFLSTRISYKLNLKGPSMTVQTACSTSLVAVHLARQSLLSGEADMALAGAMSVRVPHRAGYFSDVGGVTSPDGHVRAFDARANGTVFGSGGGIVVLKRFADAIAAGDAIRAVIKGSAVNNDGAEKAGYTAPSVNGQADAVVEALANAGVDADSVSYVEAHGSGTPVGDPIEITALTKAFRTSTARSGYCAIGSVKTNIGHLDAAAGIAGLIKTVLALEHRELPATLHYSQSNPEIDFPSTPFYVNARRTPWKSSGPRRAGIMSTGMGGTNVHLVLEEAAPPGETVDSGLPKLLVLSARSAAALDVATVRMREFLGANPSVNMDDVAFTLQAGRRSFPDRRFIVCRSREDAVAGLAGNSKRLASSHVTQARRPLVLLLPGVGDHYVGMGHDLYQHFEVFRNEVDRCARILEPHLGGDIRNVLYPEDHSWQGRGRPQGIDLKKMLGSKSGESESPDSKRLNQAINAQPALFTVEYALARLWIDLGVVPDAIVGHSMGEYVAACLAGVMSLEDALRLIVRRTQLVDQLPMGRMLAVALSEQELLPQLAPGLSIALINGPNLCVVAGSADEVGALEAVLSAKDIICRPVRNTHAFHSRLLDPVVKAFEDEVRKVALTEPKIPFASNVTGTWITRSEATSPAYWASHTNHTARFSDALRALWRLSNPILLEAGPGKTLSVLATQHPDRHSGPNPTALSSLRHHYDNQNDTELLLSGVGGLWLCGVEIKWDNLHQRRPRRKTPLPTYPFERQKYWLENTDVPPTDASPARHVEPAYAGIDDWFYVPTWERTPFPTELDRQPPSIGPSWLVFLDRWGGGLGFRKKLEDLGAAVNVVRCGETFRAEEDGSFEIGRAAPDDYLSVFHAIKGRLGESLNILHLGCVTGSNAPADYGARDQNQDLGFFSLIYIARAIGELGISIPVRIGVISNRMHEVTGEESLDPAMATVLGASGVIPREFPHIACFNVDLPEPRAAEDLSDDHIARLLAEFAEPSHSGVIAYRGKHRWKRGYERVNLPVPTGAVRIAPRRRLRDLGVYLITGGTGRLGLAFAKYLAQTCGARIALTKKTAFPDKSQWRKLSDSQEAPEAVIATIRELLEIERLGGEVEVFVADVSDKEQMREVLDKTFSRFQAINGVLHVAGIVRHGLIRTLAKEMADRVLSPKVDGTMVLFDLLRGVDLDFMVLCSSMSSITFPFAHADYCAANSFLDAFASYANSQAKFHTLAINWPIWKEAVIGSGASYFSDLEALLGVQDLQEEALKRAIVTVDGLEAFARALNSDLSQIIVSPQDLDDLIERSTMAPARSAHALSVKGATSLNGGGADDLDRPTNEIEATVTRIWMDVFGHEHIGMRQQFFALGGHSLVAMQIVAKVRSEYQVPLSLKEFFTAPTIAQLSVVIKTKLVREHRSLSDDKVRRLMRGLDDEETS